MVGKAFTYDDKTNQFVETDLPNDRYKLVIRDDRSGIDNSDEDRYFSLSIGSNKLPLIQTVTPTNFSLSQKVVISGLRFSTSTPNKIIFKDASVSCPPGYTCSSPDYANYDVVSKDGVTLEFVANLKEGDYNIQVASPKAGFSNTIPVKVSENGNSHPVNIRPQAIINNIPTLTKRLDAEKNEIELVSSFKITIIAGSSDQKISKSRAFYSVLTDGRYTAHPDSQTYSKPAGVIDNGGDYYTIPSSKTVTFYVESRFNPGKMFASTYKAYVYGLSLGDNPYINVEIKDVTPSNALVVIGERSPYVNKITQKEVLIGSQITLTGVRFSTTGSIDLELTNYDGLCGTIYLCYKESTRSSDDKNIKFAVPNIAPGVYNLQLSDSKTGGSNYIQITINKGGNVIQPIPIPTSAGRPLLLSISPQSGRYGDTVTLKGSDLININNGNKISIRNSRGEINPVLVSYTNTSVSFKVPNIPYETYDVTVFDDNEGDSNVLKLIVLSPVQTPTPIVNTPVYSTPHLSSISPSSARYGDTVTLYGSNLSNIVTNQLSIRNSSGGEINPSIISKTSTSITFKLPNIPYETYDVMVFDANDSNSLKLTVLSPTQTGVGAPSTSPSSSSYIAPAPTYTTPYITKTSPTIVKAGDTVTLEGVNFEGVDSSLVFIRNNTGGEINPEVTSISNTKITFKVPNISYGTYSVSLLGDKGDSNTVTITIGSTSGASAISVWGWLFELFN